MRLIIGISGASGVIYGIRLLEVLKEVPDIETHLVMSAACKLNVKIETDWETSKVTDLAAVVHSNRDTGANIASGSFKTEGMIIAPCSMKTLSGIVNSYADNLLVRAADVVLKEGRRLVLLPRELLYEACNLGAIIAPPMPAMYNRPETIDDVINHTVGRILDLFDIDPGIVKRWKGVKNQIMDKA
jgi:4-hydroxy-3-polyprenylbenzoate decarboxylase